MDERLWEKMDGVFHAALERPPHERDAFLAEVCGGDAELRREVDQLLEHDARENPAIDSPAPEWFDVFQKTELKEGTNLGPYRITGALGAGGMGLYTGRKIRAWDGRSRLNCCTTASRSRLGCGSGSSARGVLSRH